MAYKLIDVDGFTQRVEKEINDAERDGYSVVFVTDLNENGYGLIVMNRPGAAPVPIKTQIDEHPEDEIPF